MRGVRKHNFNLVAYGCVWHNHFKSLSICEWYIWWWQQAISNSKQGLRDSMVGHVTFFEFCRCMSLQWHINIFETRIVMESNHAQSTCTSCSQRFVSQRLKFIVHLGDPHHQLLYRNKACFCSRVLTTGALREIKLGTMTKRRVSMRPPVPVGANAVLLAQGAKAWPPAFMKTFKQIQVPSIQLQKIRSTLHDSWIFMVPVVPHKAVAEVSRIGKV